MADNRDENQFIAQLNLLLKINDRCWQNKEDITAAKVKEFADNFKVHVMPNGVKLGVKGLIAKYTGIGSKSNKILKDLSKALDNLAKIFKKDEDLKDAKKLKKIKDAAKKVVKKVDEAQKLYKNVEVSEDKKDESTGEVTVSKNNENKSKAFLGKVWETFKKIKPKFEMFDELSAT